MAYSNSNLPLLSIFSISIFSSDLLGLLTQQIYVTYYINSLAFLYINCLFCKLFIHIPQLHFAYHMWTYHLENEFFHVIVLVPAGQQFHCSRYKCSNVYAIIWKLCCFCPSWFGSVKIMLFLLLICKNEGEMELNISTNNISYFM